MFWTNRVEVDVTILQSEHLQVLQSHVGGLLHCLQILLTVRKQIRDLFQGKAEIKRKKFTKQGEGLKKDTCAPAGCLRRLLLGEEQRRSDLPVHF